MPKSKTQNPIIIALTASSFVQDKARILGAGCDDFLSKPFLEADLFRLIGQHLGIELVNQTTDAPPSAALKAGLLAQLPGPLREELTEAIKVADIQNINILLTRIEAGWPRAAQALKPFLDEFRYNELLTILATDNKQLPHDH